MRETFLLLMAILLFPEMNAEAQSTQNETQYDSSKQFKITIGTYNHAERVFGGTMYYNISDSLLQVLNIPLFDTVVKVVFSKSLSDGEETMIKTSVRNLDSLKDFYFNYCIMPTSGDEFSVRFENDSGPKSIWLHHYYLEQIKELVESMNVNLPKEYKIKYLRKGTKQDCAL